MQIRQIDLKELDSAYGVVKELYPNFSYKEFEDLVYDMRHVEYKMFGVYERDELVSYAGIVILTTLKDKRHLRVFDFKTSNKYDVQKYDKIMKEYLEDFAKIGMCERVIYEN